MDIEWTASFLIWEDVSGKKVGELFLGEILGWVFEASLTIRDGVFLMCFKLLKVLERVSLFASLQGFMYLVFGGKLAVVENKELTFKEC